ncbi:alpha/beta-hydrolase [Penicillium sp. IBT 16267x]|nr:alpha/beta-hydrolase [Penicillium sp. IBT 16267x]
MANVFNILPPNTPGKPEPFAFHVSEEELVEFRDLLKLSTIGPATWWNQQKTSEFGVSLEWLSKAKETWLTSFDWQLLVEKYTPETLPYHVIVPSLPDFGLSSRSSQSIEMTLDRAAFIMNQLMLDLGFGGGYVAQGGDLGSMLARIMSVQYNECKALHVNMLTLNPGQSAPSSDGPTPEELRIIKRTEAWRQTGLAYALEHGTRPATVGLAISSSPLAMLAWIGEKLLEWTGPREPFTLDTVLSMVSFYWFTRTFPRSLYHATLVRNLLAGDPHPISMEKPLGYSLFPYDLAVLPKAWAEGIYPNLAFFRSHSKVNNTCTS